MIAAERNSLAPLCYTNKEVMSTNSQQVNQPVRPGKASWDEGKPRRVVVQCLSFRDEHKPVLDSVPLSPALRLPGSPAILQMFAHLSNERMGIQLPKCLKMVDTQRSGASPLPTYREASRNRRHPCKKPRTVASSASSAL